MDEGRLTGSNLCILGIDPGLSGAVCRIGKNHFDILRDFKTRRDIAKAITRLAEGVTHVVMELVHAMPGQGVCSMFSFGRASGVADGALSVALPDVTVQEVTPQRWQSFYRSLLDIPLKAPFDSRAVASTILPCASPYLKRKKDHNSADSILIAAWKLLATG